MKREDWLIYYNNLISLYNNKTAYDRAELCGFIETLVNTKTDDDSDIDVVNAKNDLNSRLYILNLNNINNVRISR